MTITEIEYKDVPVGALYHVGTIKNRGLYLKMRGTDVKLSGCDRLQSMPPNSGTRSVTVLLVDSEQLFSKLRSRLDEDNCT